MEMVLTTNGDIESVLAGWRHGGGEISRSEAFSIVKAVENFENATGDTIRIDPMMIVQIASFIRKASEIFDYGENIDPNVFLDWATGDSNDCVFPIEDGAEVIRTHNPEIPFVHFSTGLSAFVIPIRDLLD